MNNRAMNTKKNKKEEEDSRFQGDGDTGSKSAISGPSEPMTYASIPPSYSILSM